MKRKLVKVNGPYWSKHFNRFYVEKVFDNGFRTHSYYARHLMELKLGRQLETEECVDHIDGDQLNDDIDNLQILTKGQNSSKQFDDKGTRKGIDEYICPNCSELFELKVAEMEHRRRRNGNREVCCSKRCSNIYRNICK